MNERLLKRLKHNVNRITEPTVKQLLADCISYLGNERQPNGDTTSITQVPGLVYPAFKAGVPLTEGEILVTAEMLNGLIERLKVADFAIKTSNVSYKDQEPVKELTDLMLMMEKAAFIGIMETYKTQKYRFPNCVTATREDGEVTTLVVHFGGADETAVTLRNPECIQKEEARLISAAASATRKTTKDEE